MFRVPIKQAACKYMPEGVITCETFTQQPTCTPATIEYTVTGNGWFQVSEKDAKLFHPQQPFRMTKFIPIVKSHPAPSATSYIEYLNINPPVFICQRVQQLSDASLHQVVLHTNVRLPEFCQVTIECLAK